MKKKVAEILMLVLLVFCLTACGSTYSQQTEIEATVIKCEEGDFFPDQKYMTLAYASIAKDNMAMYAKYIKLAEENGTYDYKVTINIDGAEYIVTRQDIYEVGDTLSVTKTDIYSDSEIIRTEYE